MVVCKCKKATKLYCFVHKIPVCGDCICFPEHSICVVRTYSEWVIDGDYDWPSRCNVCRTELQDGAITTRLGCLHVVHTNCLSTHLQSFPPHTAPAGYVCPTCATSIWPPKSIKDAGSGLYSKLKDSISKNDVGKILLGNSVAPGKRSESSGTTQSPVTEINTISSVVPEPTSTTGASAMTAYDGSYPSVIGTDASAKTSSDIVDIDGAVSINLSPNASGPGATTRKGPYRGDRYNSHLSSRDDDEDEIKPKYARRGSLHRKFLRFLLPFWSPALPTLPVTAPKKEERDAGMTADDDLHLRRRRSSVDPRKILLFIAILSCLATMMLLYYRLSQSNATNEVSELEQQ